MKFSTLRNLMLTMLVLGVAGSVVTAGTFGLFSASTPTAGQTFSSGNISLTNSASGSQITVTMPTKIIPGDQFGGPLDITNNGNVDFDYKLTTSAGTTALFSDTTNGLQMWIQRCTVAWVPATPTTTDSCSGTKTNVLGTALTAGNTVALSQTNASFGTLCATGAGSPSANDRTQRGVTCNANTGTGVDHLLVLFTLPTASTTAQVGNLSEAGVVFTFSATQSGLQPAAF